VLAAAALTCGPAVHVSFVEQLLQQTVGRHIDSLVEGVSLIVAFILVSAASVGHRDDPADRVSPKDMPLTPGKPAQPPLVVN
jgi:hypothetical protein